MRNGKKEKGSHLIRSGKGVMTHFFSFVIKTWPWSQRDLGCNPSPTFDDLFNLSDHLVSL